MTKPRQIPPERRRTTPRLSRRAVVAAWLAAIGWISVEPFTTPHDVSTMRWMNSVTLLLVAFACTLMIAWLILERFVEPHNDWIRAFELGYRACEQDQQQPTGPDLTIIGDAARLSVHRITYANGNTTDHANHKAS